MNVFEAVKQSVTTRQAASFYGIRVGRNGMVCCPFHNDRTPSMKVDSRFYCFGCGASGDVIDFSALLHGLRGNGKLRSGLRRTSAFPMRNPAMRRQIGSVTTGHSPDKNQRSRDFRNGTVLFPGAMRLSAPVGALENSIRPTAAVPLASLFCGSVAEDKLHRIPFGYFVIRRNRRKSGVDRRTGKGGAALEQRIRDCRWKRRKRSKRRWTQWNRRRHQQKSGRH